MSMDPPDPRSFKDWDEAFQYQIPTVRKFEQTLRSHVDENREKLRTLVGASYRELLGTADRIIEMDEQIQLVELSLGNVTQRCNSRAVEKLFTNYAKFHSDLTFQNKERNSLASQLAILQSCAAAISRLLKRGASPLLAAKVLVLSRVTHKVLSQRKSGDSRFIDNLRNRLDSLRRKLLASIDRRLSNPDTEWQSLVDDMCAFSLATSATPTDIMKHFHKIRLQAVTTHLEESKDVKGHALSAMKLLVRTVQVSQLVFPRRLADSLAKLKDLPLLQHKDVLSMDELNLDLHERWIADELRNYTPFPRHDELQKPESERLLNSWAKQAFKSFVDGLKTNLSRQQDFQQVTVLRKELFDAWPWSSGRLPGLDSTEVIDALRDLVNDRLIAMIQSQTSSIERFPGILSKSLEESPLTENPAVSLWDSSITSMELSSGASFFKKSLLDRYHGLDHTTAALIQIYDEWMSAISSLRSLIKDMREIRWDEDIIDEDDDLGLDSRQILLSEDDPRLLEEALANAISKAFDELQIGLEGLVGNVAQESDPTPQKSLVVLHVLREVIQRSALSVIELKALEEPPHFASSLILPLYTQLARVAVQSAMVSYQRSLQKFVKASKSKTQLLWEGNPPLPMQPSPSVFLFLRKLNHAMSSCGGDVWASGAVLAVKGKAEEDAGSTIRKAIETLEKSKGIDTNTNGNGGETEAENVEPTEQDEKGQSNNLPKGQKEIFTQLLFDTLYLRRALESQGKGHTALGSLVSDLSKKAEVEEDSIMRLQRFAAEYWKRTYLLFALLAAS